MPSEVSTESSAFILPDEIWLQVFSHLRSNDILRIRLVCKEWAHLSTFPEIRQKLRLRLDSHSKLSELKTYITEKNHNYLPVHGLNIVKLMNDKNLDILLQELGPQLHELQLNNSIVFQTIASANLKNIERLELKFNGISPDRFDDINMDFIRDYHNLKSLNFICPHELLHFGMNIQKELLAADRIHSLQHLQLSFHDDEMETFRRILEKYGSTLKELEIYFESQRNLCYPDEWFEVLDRLKNLEILRISGDCKWHFTSKFFRNLPASAPLHVIDLDGITSLTDDMLQDITDKWVQKIKHLRIFVSSKITNAGAIEIGKLRKNLESLRIRYCQTLSMRELLNAVANDENFTLRQFCANSMGRVDDNYLDCLAKNLPNLEKLDLSDNTHGLTNRVLGHIFRFQTNLRELTLNGCCGFDDNGIRGLGVPEWNEKFSIDRLQKLEVLSLQSCKGLRRSFVDHLILPNLHTLNLGYLKYITPAGFCKIVDNCPRLEVLHAAYCDGINDEVLHYICGNLKLLLELNIENCTKVSDAAIKDAMQLYRIKHIAFTEQL